MSLGESQPCGSYDGRRLASPHRGPWIPAFAGMTNCGRLSAPRSQALSLVVVAVPAAPRLAAFVTGRHQLAQQRSRQEALAIGGVEDFVNAERERIGGVVHQLERPDRMA